MSPVAPPDPQLAVGSSSDSSLGFLVEAFNRGLRFYDRGGTAITSAAIPFWAFFGLPPASNLFDPRLVFDPYSGRFVLLVLQTEDGVSPPLSVVHLAVSKTADPTQSWALYQAAAPPGFHADFPSLGYDGVCFYGAANLFSFSQSTSLPPSQMWMFALEKAPILNGGSPGPMVSFTPPSGSLQPWAPRAVEQLDLPDSAPPVGLFVSSFNGPTGWPFQILRVYKLRDPLGANPGLYPFDVKVPPYAPPSVDAPQAGGSVLDVLSGQLLNAVWRDGDLYTAHTTRWPVSGPWPRNAARWYQIRTGPPSAPVWWSALVQSGEIDDEIASFEHSLTPAISVDANLSVALVFTATSFTSTPRLAVASRAACDPPGLMGPVVTLKTSLMPAFFCFGAPSCSFHRWGDYFGIATDPDQPATLWAVGEYVDPGLVWGTWISSLRINPSCGACSCRP